MVAIAVTRPIVGFVNWIAGQSPLWRGLAVAALSGVIGTLFVWFRSRAPIYGDGFTVVSDSLSPLLAPPDSYHEAIKIVPVLLYRLGGTLLTKQLHLDANLSAGIVSSLGGVAGFWGLWRIVRSVSRDVGQSVTLMSIGLAGGCTVLFFGHLELYTWGIATLLWLLAAAVDFTHGRTGPFPVWCWIIVAASMQMLFLPTLLTIALVLLSLHRPNRKAEPLLAFGLSPKVLGWGLFISSLVVGCLFTLVPTEFTFVPLWPQETNPYAAFSSAHLLDQLNLIYLVSPLALTTLLILFTDLKRVRSINLNLGEKLLGLCVLSLFLVTFWLDPTLGALRDWDLLSLFGIPAAIFCGVTLLKRFPGETSQAVVTALSICLIFVVPAPHIAARTDGERELLRIDPMVWQDPHYQPSYQEAHATLPWAAMIQTFSANSDLADKYLRRKISISPETAMAWFNLGEIELDRKHFDSAATILERAYRLSPGSDVCLARYAQALQANGQRDKLSALMPRITAMQSGNPKALQSAGIVLVNEGRSTEALAVFRRAYALRPWGYLQCLDLGRTFFIMNQYDSAADYFAKALYLPEASKPGVYHALVMIQVKQHRLQQARATLEEFRRNFPDDPSIQDLQTLLRQLQ